MSAPSVMPWGEAEVHLTTDGTAARLQIGTDLVVELAWSRAKGASPEVDAVDEVEHTLETPAGRVFQRHSVFDSWRARWVLIGRDDRAVELSDRLRVLPGTGFCLWSWGSGATALLAVAPEHRAGPVLGLRLEQGYLEEAEAQPENGAIDYQIARSSSVLAPGQRMVLTLGSSWYTSIDDLAGRLPAWLGEPRLSAGEPWCPDLADFGVETPEDVVVDCSEGTVSVVAPPGRRTIEVQTPRGLSRIGIEWVPALDTVLGTVATHAVSSREQLSVGAALCLQFAANRQLVWLDRRSEDRLDRVDWMGDGSLLALAFGLARGLSLGETALVSDALLALGGRPVEVGFPRVVMGAWMTSVALGLSEREYCLGLLKRPGQDQTAALECSLVSQANGDEAELAGVVNRLGGRLPGSAPLLNWTALAQLIGLLELCPPAHGQAAYCAEVAAKARGSVFCGYVDGAIRDLDPLAWVLLNEGLGTFG